MIIYDMPNDDYHSHGAISRSGLALIGEAPKKYWYKYLSGQYNEKESDALRVGSAFHTLVLEPESFNDRFFVWSGLPKNTNAGKEDYKKAVVDAEKRYLLKQCEYDTILKMANSVRIEPATKKIITGSGKIEASIFWEDESTGRQVKCRPDFIKEDGLILDVKTVASASLEDFEKSIINYHYDVQAYMCIEGAKKAGLKAEAFVFMCVEKDPPYCTAFYMADDSILKSGEIRFRKWLEIYDACMKKNDWPAYGSLIKTIGLPSWYMKRIEGEMNV